MIEQPQHVGIGHAHELRGVHLKVAGHHVAQECGELLGSDLHRNADTGEILLDGGGLNAIDLGRRRLQRQGQSGARPVTVGIRKPRRVEQTSCLRWIVPELEDVAAERPGHRRHDPDRGSRKPAAQILDDGLAIDRIPERLPHLEPLQDRIAQVQRDVGVVGARRGFDAQFPLALHLPHDIGRDVVDDEIDGAFAQLEAAHRVVGNHLQHETGILCRPAEVLVEPRQHDTIVRPERDQLVRPGPDRRAGVGRSRPGLDDAHHQVHREGHEWRLQAERDRIRIEDVDGADVDVRVRPPDELRIDQAAEGVGDVFRGQLAAVVKLHPAANPRDVGERVGTLDRLGQVRHDAEIGIDANERVVEQLMNLLRRLVGSNPRIEIHRRIRHTDHDAVRILARADAPARRGQRDNAQDPDAQRPSHAQHPIPKTEADGSGLWKLGVGSELGVGSWELGS